MDKGSLDAINILAGFYSDGRGVAENISMAVHLYERAAGKGHAGSMVVLGLWYHNGRGVVKNPENALSWFRQAAEQGHPYALHNVGYHYESGSNGKEPNEEKAIEYYKKAADAGSRISINVLKERFRVAYTPPVTMPTSLSDDQEKLFTLQPAWYSSLLSQNKAASLVSGALNFVTRPFRKTQEEEL